MSTIVWRVIAIIILLVAIRIFGKLLLLGIAGVFIPILLFAVPLGLIYILVRRRL